MKKLLSLLLLSFGLLSTKAAVTPFQSFDTNFFTIITNVPATIIVQINTNYTSNTNIIFNFYTTTNVFVITSNIYANNIQGDAGRLAKFIANYGLTNSIVLETNDVLEVNGQGGSTLYNWLKLPHLVQGPAYIGPDGVVTNGISNGTNTIVTQLGPFTIGRYPKADSTNTLTDGSFYEVGSTNVGFDGVLLWGPGTTNALFRSGGNLVYTNGTSNPGFQIISGIGESSYFLAGSSAALVRGINGVTLSDESGNTVRLFAKYFAPSVTDEKLGGDYGTSLHPWAQVNSLGETIWGYKGTESTNYSRLAISHTGTNGTILLDSQSSGIAGNPRPTALTFGGTNLFQFSPEGVMTWGPGTTNVLYRSGIFLTYTNGSSSQYPGFEVRSGDGSTARFLAGGNLAVLRGNAGAGLLDSLTAGREVRWFGDRFSPLQTSSSLGALDSVGPYQWNHVSTKTNFVNGFITTVSTNYSRFVISHSGTNGAVILDSQGSGIAGNARPLAFQFGGTNNVILTPNGPMILPSLTRAQRDAVSPTNGMVFYQSDSTAGLRAYIGGAWYTVNVTADP